MSPEPLTGKARFVGLASARMMYRGIREVFAAWVCVLALCAVACSSPEEKPQDEPQAGSDGDAATSEASRGGTGGMRGADSGDDDDETSTGQGSDAGVDAGPLEELDEDRALSGLSDLEIKFLCAELAELADTIADEEDVARLGCVLLASAFAGSGGSFDVATCQEMVDACPITSEGVISTMRCDADGLRAATMSCELSVGQYRECVVASAEKLAELLDAYSCQSLGEADAAAPESIDTSPSAVAECAPVMAACPALFGPDEGGPAENGCDDSCSESKDRFCDDGGPGSLTNLCPLGTDCSDCGQR